MTNIPDYNPTSDAIQLRPFEILCQVGFSGQATTPGSSKCLTANAAASDSACVIIHPALSCAAHETHCQGTSTEQTPNLKPLEYPHRRCGPSCGRRASAHPRSPPGRGFLMSIRRVRICDPFVTQSPPCAKGRTMEACKVTGLFCCDMMHSVSKCAARRQIVLSWCMCPLAAFQRRQQGHCSIPVRAERLQQPGVRSGAAHCYARHHQGMLRTHCEGGVTVACIECGCVVCAMCVINPAGTCDRI